MKKFSINRARIIKCVEYICYLFVIYLEWYTFAVHHLQGEFFLTENFVDIFLFIGIAYILYRFLLVRDKVVLFFGGIAGILYGIAIIIGNKLYAGDLMEIFTSLRSVVKYGVLLFGEVLFWIQVYALLFGKILLLQLKKYEYKLRERRNKKIFWAGAWLIMALCYLPCYLSNFPGIMSYDSGWITRQALGIIPFDNFHPFLHTLIWTAFIKVEQLTGIPQFGLVSYTIVQVLVVTAMFTYMVYYLAIRGVRRGIVVAAWLFYAFSPNIVLFSLITTKDVLFGTALMGFFLSLLRLSEIYARSEGGGGR